MTIKWMPNLKVMIWSVAIGLLVVSGIKTAYASMQVACIFEELELSAQPCIGDNVLCQTCNQMGGACSQDETIYTDNTVYTVRATGRDAFEFDAGMHCTYHDACIATAVPQASCVVHAGGVSYCYPDDEQTICSYCKPASKRFTYVVKSSYTVSCPIGVGEEE